MQTIIEIKSNINKVFARQNDEQKIANMDILNYIDQVAKTSGVNIMSWNIAELFKDPSNKKQSLELIKNRGQINKIFFTEADRLKSTPSIESDRVKDLLTKSLEKTSEAIKAARAQQLTQKAEQEQVNILAYYRELQTRTERIVSYKKQLAELFNQNCDEKIVSDIGEVLQGNFYEFVEISGTKITFATKNDIINTLVKPSAGINLNVNLGKFKIEINLENLRMKVLPHKDNVLVDRFPHPHVDSAGDICWGNVARRASELLQALDVKGVLLLLATLLTTYNEENPFRSLDRFDAERKKIGAQNFTVAQMAGQATPRTMSVIGTHPLIQPQNWVMPEYARIGEGMNFIDDEPENTEEVPF